MIGSFVWIICLFAIQAQTEEIRPRFDTDERIMRGADFIRGEFPWIVALLKRSDDPEKIDKLFCGGTLVSKKRGVDWYVECKSRNYFLINYLTFLFISLYLSCTLYQT